MQIVNLSYMPLPQTYDPGLRPEDSPAEAKPVEPSKQGEGSQLDMSKENARKAPTQQMGSSPPETYPGSGMLDIIA